MNNPQPVADVCIVVEGSYPHVVGGVSSWLDWLMRSQPETTFSVVAIVADERPRELKYKLPDNLLTLQTIALAPAMHRPGLRQRAVDADRLADALYGILHDGSLAAFDDLLALVAEPVPAHPFPWLGAMQAPDAGDLTSSPAAWQALTSCYRRIAPQASFNDFFWGWRALAGSLLSVVTAPIPPARSYHALSTGYAGLFAVRAARVMGCRAAITEHGVYTNERRIDIIMADWIADTIDAGLAGDDRRVDVRRFWTDAFEAFARIAYQGSARITTLFATNQSFQRALGAREERLAVIPNGIAVQKYDAIVPQRSGRRPTVALIGRVVPIKDIETFISAAAIIRHALPDVEVLVIGPTDEDEDYYTLCRRRVTELDLEDTVRFTGKADILDYLPRIDVLVLTSISEAQPLVLLEAGAARVPCIVTDVGSCREIIEGTPNEFPNPGLAGRVVPPMDPEATGAAVIELMSDEALRLECGEALRRRVEQRFTSDLSADRYAALYAELVA